MTYPGIRKQTATIVTFFDFFCVSRSAWPAKVCRLRANGHYATLNMGKKKKRTDGGFFPIASWTFSLFSPTPLPSREPMFAAPRWGKRKNLGASEDKHRATNRWWPVPGGADRVWWWWWWSADGRL